MCLSALRIFFYWFQSRSSQGRRWESFSSTQLSPHISLLSVSYLPPRGSSFWSEEYLWLLFIPSDSTFFLPAYCSFFLHTKLTQSSFMSIYGPVSQLINLSISLPIHASSLTTTVSTLAAILGFLINTSMN